MSSRESAGPASRDPSPPRSYPNHTRSHSDGPRKEKKRVGFTGDPLDQRLSSRDESSLHPPPARAHAEAHAHAHTIFHSPDSPNSPRDHDWGLPTATSDNGPSPVELRRALTRILVTEAEDSDPGSSGSGSVPGPNPSRPRPTLRRNTSYDTPQEKEQADLAERLTPSRQQKSGVEARQRASRLAVSVESYSSPPSRRGSNDMTRQPLHEVEEEGQTEKEEEQAAPPYDRSDHNDRYDRDNRDNRDEATSTAVDHGAESSLRPRKTSHVAAENLVRAHTQRARKGIDQPELFRFNAEDAPFSRPGTPTDEQDYIDDYVPRPEMYRGGVLGLVLKLYNGANGGNSGDASGRNTPVTSTPNTSPPTSAPPSRPSSRPPSGPPSRPGSVPSSPKRPLSRPSSGFFGYHKSQGSRSSLALNELMKSTSALIAPASAGVSGGVSEKLKKEPIPSSGKKPGKPASRGSHGTKEKRKGDDQVRITKHIAQILSRHRYLAKLCRALMTYGAPTHRLEEYMAMSARVLEIEGQFLYLPGCMIISFDDSSTHTTEVKIVRAPQGLDLGKLRDVHDLYKEVVHDRMSVDDAIVKLDQIMARKLKFSNWIRIPLYGLASACVAPFAFQGRFIDMPIAFVLGCLLGFLQLILAPSNELYANVFEITAAIATSFLARAFGSIRGGDLFCFSALAQSSIALILPGYMVLCSSLELQSHNLVAGSVRMVYAMIYTLFLGYGITIGTALYGLIDQEGATSETTCRGPLDRRWHLLFVPCFTLCLCIINQAKWKQTPVMLIISLAGFVANSYSSDYLQGNTHISNLLGALTVGIMANLYSRLRRHMHRFWHRLVDWYRDRVAPRFLPASRRRHRNMSGANAPPAYQGNGGHHPVPLADLESRPGSPTAFLADGDDEKPQDKGKRRRRTNTGYGLAAAAMLPAIFVQVPSGIAAGGSLLAGVTSADQITSTINGTATAVEDYNLNGTAFTVLFAVIQVAIGITVGLFLSALIVYPFGKRRSGLLSF
ncbi:DUF1212-domain-containing protein [Sodiomyces alkalinus F11]|uniref:DUF1212-domain-containing protein n=1 Tax=Sodiomyces alkalinus (strain CBS 110278 / VKM F-3762 / F11) TaxID=1314773 RepID=A0A3N2Q3G9_SODAK|nr:DUF1212-domain-containing protein [Sodiomyces alkalinus F11]ROT41313.1 DUF1212-domain-containing protein [Sodiomyces alkalinus F11]